MHMRDQNWAVAQSREASPILNSMDCVLEKRTMYHGFDQVLAASAIDQSPRTSGGTYMTSTEVDAPQHWGVAAQTSTSSRCAKLACATRTLHLLLVTLYIKIGRIPRSSATTLAGAMPSGLPDGSWLDG